jgi:uncharacterized protein (UPF0332 family)
LTPPPSVDVALSSAIENVAGARALQASGRYAMAVSRAYYATLYASMALLASAGMHGKTHDGVRTLVNMHFVRTGKLPAETSMLLAQVEGARIQADYDLAAVITADGALAIIEQADTYVNSVKAVVAGG